MFSGKKIYISGIAGIGISAAAQYLHYMGNSVSGSDLVENHVTALLRKKGIKIFDTQSADNIPSDIDLFIFSPAVPDTHPERLRAVSLCVPVISYPKFLSEITKLYHTIAISGTNGKTTTTAWLGHVLASIGKDPTVIVGSFVSDWKTNLRIGKSELFVVEACEHRAHMTGLHTNDCIVTNIEEDHLDYYKDINEIVAAFQKFIDRNSPEGLIILNADDPNTLKLQIPKNRKIITFGFSEKSNVRAFNVSTIDGMSVFSLQCTYEKYQSSFQNVRVRLPGRFNIHNALAVCAYAVGYGLYLEKVIEALYTFRGTWRRFEEIGVYEGMNVISDYAHHPSAIRFTISAAREKFPNKKIIVVFQPHQHNRTKNLFNDFIEALSGADLSIIQEIFDVVGREESTDQNVSSLDIVEKLHNLGCESYFSPDHLATKSLIEQYKDREAVLLIMGAGDIYEIAESFSSPNS